MPSSDAGEVEPGATYNVPFDRSEPGTDPGRARPFETLYRDSTQMQVGAHRTTARHFEPWLTPPEDGPESGDTFHWLYRQEAPADAGRAGARPLPSAPEAHVLAAGVSAQPEPRHLWRRIFLVALVVVALAAAGWVIVVTL